MTFLSRGTRLGGLLPLLLLLLLLLMVIGLLAGTASAQESFRSATEGTYPSWSFKDAQDTLQSWDVKIAHALCDKMKARCEIVAQDWDGILPSLLARTYDMIVASLLKPRRETSHPHRHVRERIRRGAS